MKMKFDLKKAIIVGIAAPAVMLGVVGCSTQVDAGQRAIMVDDYWMVPTDPTVEGCIEPETSKYNGLGGFKAYKYPSRQISWDATGGEDAESDPTVVVSSAEAPAELKVPVVLTFDLTADCEKLKNFHRDFGTKYQGWLNDDGTASDGWRNLLRYAVGQPMEQTLFSVAQKYTWRDIWNNKKVRIEFQNTLREQLPDASKRRTNNVAYFENFQVSVMKPDPVDGNLKKAINEEQAAIAKARGAELGAEAEITSAQKQTELARQKALQKQAEISGYPSVEDYLKAKMIEKGLNPYQPSYPNPVTPVK